MQTSRKSVTGEAASCGGAGGGSLCATKRDNEKRQIIHRLPTDFIRQTLADFRANVLHASEARHRLGVGKSRLYQLRMLWLKDRQALRVEATYPTSPWQDRTPLCNLPAPLGHLIRPRQSPNLRPDPPHPGHGNRSPERHRPRPHQTNPSRSPAPQSERASLSSAPLPASFPARPALLPARLTPGLQRPLHRVRWPPLPNRSHLQKIRHHPLPSQRQTLPPLPPATFSLGVLAIRKRQDAPP